MSLVGRFSAWPTLEGTANRLEVLSILSDELFMIPTDESFKVANLENLERIFVSSTKLKSMPNFWADLPNLQIISVSSGYVGPIQVQISAPRLKGVSLRTNSLCGSLPDFIASTHLEHLILSANRFSGSIPQSWEDHVSIMDLLDIGYNALNGTVPPHLLDHHASYRQRITLSGNNFTGPLWNMTRGMPQYLVLGNTGLDICAQNPSFSGDIASVTCDFRPVQVCPSRCPSYWTACKPPISCTEGPIVVPSISTCSIPNERCPLPQPAPGFLCNRGAWVFIGTPSESSFSLPASSNSIVIYGNLSSGGTITFSGTDTSLQIQGCVLVPPSQVVIELSETTNSTVTLIVQQGKNCSTDLSQIPVVVISSKEDCKKTIASKSSTPSSLTLTFSVVNDDCSKSAKKWVILGSSVGAVVVLFSVACLVLYYKFPSFKRFVRTCSTSDDHKDAHKIDLQRTSTTMSRR